jgi:peroxiredoxin
MRNVLTLLSTKDRVVGACRRLFLIALWLFPATARGADSPRVLPSSAVLHLSNGGFAAGELCDANDPAVLRWHATPFVSPFDFDLKRVNAVYFPAPAKSEKAAGEYCFELSGGDLVSGSLLGLNADEAELEVPHLGRLRLRRNQIQQFFRWQDGAGLVYRGPNGLDDWTASPSGDAWRIEHGQLMTDKPGAFVQGNFALPPRAAIEFEISWKDNPDFVLALGIGHDDGTVGRAFHIEAWGHEVVILRETEREAEIASLQKITHDWGRVHLLVYLDQETGRCLVYSSKGKLLADLKIAGKNRQALPGLRLTNKRGGLWLERLQVAHWSGAPPGGDVALDKPRLHLTDGTIKYGEIASYDVAAKTFLLRGEGGSRIPADRIESAFLAQTNDAKPRALTIAYQNSSRVSGSLLKVENKTIWIACPSVREPLRLPLAGLRSLIFNGGETAPSTTPDGSRSGILESDGVRLPGRLIDGRQKKNASCLIWQPQESATSSPLRPAAAGRIVYRESPAARPQPREAQGIRRVVRLNNVDGRMIRRFSTSSPQEPSHELKRKALYLRTGDTIPCEVTRIDQNGVSFTSPLSDATFVAHDKIKAVELTLDGRGPVGLTKSKRERLLTLPRMQKENPPTHLIRSRDGDYLRGRILEMDDRKLLVELRLETKELPRDRISRIIWLHPDELKEASAAGKSTRAAPAARVQALRSDGIRLTFRPEQFADATLSGTSDVLGTCRAELDSVDQILIGAAIDEAATRAAYQQWKLQYAQEPKFVRDENSKSSEGASAGTESALVGKPAPDFELELLGGDKFHLAEHKGKIIVLDFWATWCSNCLQTMPELAQVHRDSAGSDVKVVAVNLEETPQEITAMLERHRLQIPVALDRDGVVATKYGVTAIPQTVIIDREGNVVRHFIGGGPHLGKNLADSLHGLLLGVPPKKPSP